MIISRTNAESLGIEVVLLRRRNGFPHRASHGQVVGRLISAEIGMERIREAIRFGFINGRGGNRGDVGDISDVDVLVALDRRRAERSSGVAVSVRVLEGGRGRCETGPNRSASSAG